MSLWPRSRSLSLTLLTPCHSRLTWEAPAEGGVMDQGVEEATVGVKREI